MIQRRLYRTSGLLTVGTALSRVTGLLRVAAMTYALGVTAARLADTYNLANTSPNIVYELFLGGIFTAVFVPVLVDIRAKERGDRSALVTTSLVVLAVVSIAAAVAAPLIIRVYTFRISDPSTRAAQLELATYLLRWFAPQIFFYGLSAIVQALLNERGRFGPPAFAPVLNNLAVTAVFVVYGRVLAEHSLHLSLRARVLLGAGTTAGVVLQAVVLLPYIRGEGLRIRPRFTDPAVTRVLRLSAYVVGYVVVNQIGLWVVLALANGQSGGVTAFTIAFMFFQLPHGLFAVSLLTALFPALSRAAAIGDWDSYRARFQSGLRSVIYLLLPATAGFVILAGPMTRLVLAHGFSRTQDADLVAGVLQALAAGLVFFSVFQLLTRCFYALQNTRTPMAVNAVAVAVNTAINFPLFAWFGVRGLGWAQSVAYGLGAVLLAVVLQRRVPGGLALRASARATVRMCGVAALMAGGVWVVARALPGADAVVLAAGVGAGAILYLAFSQVAGIDEREILLVFLRRSGAIEEEGGR